MSEYKFLVIVVVCMLNIGSFSALGKEAANVGLEVGVEWNSKSDPELVFSMKSHSSHTLRFNHGFLPWSTWQSLILVCVPVSWGAAVLENSTPINDPPLIAVKLEPGAELKGRVSLVKRFPSLIETLKSKDVQLFWAYDIEPLGDEGIQTVTGAIRLQRIAK